MLLSKTLRDAIDNKLLNTTLAKIAEEAGVDPGNLSQFYRGKRGLSARATESLCHRLGVRLKSCGPDSHEGPLLTVLRNAISESPQSIRSIGIRTKIDQGNLSRFVRHERDGLSFKNIDKLCDYLKIDILWSGTLSVTVLRQRKVGDVSPISKATVDCIIPMFGTQNFLTGQTDDLGSIQFENIPLGSKLEVRVNGISSNIEMLETDHKFEYVI